MCNAQKTEHWGRRQVDLWGWPLCGWLRVQHGVQAEGTAVVASLEICRWAQLLSRDHYGGVQYGQGEASLVKQNGHFVVWRAKAQKSMWAPRDIALWFWLSWIWPTCALAFMTGVLRTLLVSSHSGFATCTVKKGDLSLKWNNKLQ